MTHSEEQLIGWTRSRLNWGENRPVDLVPIFKGGSDRRFFRVLAGEDSCILMAYGPDKEENQYYARIGQFLHGLGVRVPRVLAHDAPERLAWMEDLGPVDLFAFREKTWDERRGLYLDTLQQVARLHELGHAAARDEGLPMMPGFDEKLYAWERDYFYNEFVGGACGIDLTAADRAALEAELRPLAEALIRQPVELVHRDFQSQNVMVRDRQCHLIDFQGMRTGTGFYDLASLLYDPYVALAKNEREDLLADYRGMRSGLPSGDDCLRLLRAAALQRLMQALGAYGFLGLKKERAVFLAHIAPALARLGEVVGGLDGLKRMPALLEQCREARGLANE
ncbi:MAG: phosphotransferase [Candidatus Methylacidiphilales bacterium]|nr:phosphotransferase [Candidatus Methylacidiphilales bacterium]